MSASMIYGALLVLAYGSSDNHTEMQRWTDHVQTLAERTFAEESSPIIIALYSSMMAYAFFKLDQPDDAFELLFLAIEKMADVRPGLSSIFLTFAAVRTREKMGR